MLYTFKENSPLLPLRCESQSLEYRSQIKTLSEHYLVINGIKSRDDKSGTYIMTDSIPTNQFTERLWPLVERGSYSDNKFRLDTGYSDMIRIGFGGGDKLCLHLLSLYRFWC